MSKKVKVALACLLMAPPGLFGLCSLCVLAAYITEPYGWILAFLALPTIGVCIVGLIIRLSHSSHRVTPEEILSSVETV